MRGIEISFEQEGNEEYYTLRRKGKNTMYRGKVRFLGWQVNAFARRFGLTEKQAYDVEFAIVDAYENWYREREKKKNEE